MDLGADVIVAQGTEAGGHGARRGRSTLPFVPIVVDLAAPTPVLAAGGIADGRGVAAALALGAAGALIGTRFQATAEANVEPTTVQAIIAGQGQDTERSSLLDIARGSPWPSHYTARTLGHPYLDRWRGPETVSPARRLTDGVRMDYPPFRRPASGPYDGWWRSDELTIHLFHGWTAAVPRPTGVMMWRRHDQATSHQL